MRAFLLIADTIVLFAYIGLMWDEFNTAYRWDWLPVLAGFALAGLIALNIGYIQQTPASEQSFASRFWRAWKSTKA